MIELIPVIMTHDDLTRIPNHLFSGLYNCRLYVPGDESLWAQLQTTTDSFKIETEALKHFEEEFGNAEKELKKRCFFLETAQHKCIGSSMAWYGDGRFDKSYGRLHWVVIDPDFQGQGLGKQLISFSLKQLSKRYEKAYLTTQTTSYKAINIYLDFGFKPYIDNSESKRAWKLLADILDHNSLL